VREQKCRWAVLAVISLALVAAGSPSDPPTRSTSQPAFELEPGVSRPATASRPAVSSQGTDLLLDGKVHRFVGVNAPDAASVGILGLGCGTEIDLDQLFSAQGPDPLVRVWLTQGLAIDHATGRRDWRGIDRVVQAAERSPTHPHLLVTLGTQSGVCDDGEWHGRSWYEAGWRTTRDGSLPTSYEQFVSDIVHRYAGSPAVAMWEPLNEPEPSDCAAGFAGGDCYAHLTCSDGAAAVLQQFFDGVGALIRSIDPIHLISTGAIGGGQCGWAGNSWLASASPYIDVLSVHEYGSDDAPTTPALQARIDQARELGKPLIVGEVGVAAGPGCVSRAERSRILDDKMHARLDAGLAAFVVWQWGSGDSPNCDFYLSPNEPISGEMRSPALQTYLEEERNQHA
jgi:hypothetical protein